MSRSHCIRMLLSIEPASVSELIEVCGWPPEQVRQAVRYLGHVTKEIRRSTGGKWALV